MSLDFLLVFKRREAAEKRPRANDFVGLRRPDNTLARFHDCAIEAMLDRRANRFFQCQVFDWMSVSEI